MSVRLSPPDTSASRCECCKHGGGEREKWINSCHCYQTTEADTTQAKLRGYASLLPGLLFVILALVWASPCHLSPSRGQGGKAHGRAAGEPGEKHATLGTGDNENETRENKSISTPHTGLLTPQQHQPYTRGQRPGFTKGSHTNAARATA